MLSFYLYLWLYSITFVVSLSVCLCFLSCACCPQSHCGQKQLNLVCGSKGAVWRANDQTKEKVTEPHCLVLLSAHKKTRMSLNYVKPHLKGRLFGEAEARRIDITKLAWTILSSTAALSKNEPLPKAASA